jgi:hypothetical protein
VAPSSTSDGPPLDSPSGTVLGTSPVKATKSTTTTASGA